jgi:hypothetical protein
VTQPSELTSLLQQLVSQQREDRLATEAQLTAIKREAALERAASEERFVGLLDRVTQRTDAQFQQMQQGMMAMFGMITQLYSHSGLAPQQPGLQGMGAPPLAVTPAPASTAAPASSTTPKTTFSLSALLGSTSRQIFSPLPATTLFQDSPSVVQSVALPVVPQALPSGGGGGGEESLPPQSTQPAASAVTTSDADTSSADPLTTSTDPLPGSASTRASTIATPPVSSDPQLPSITEGSPSDDDDLDRFLAVPRQQDP